MAKGPQKADLVILIIPKVFLNDRKIGTSSVNNNKMEKNKMVSNIFAINNSSSNLPLASPYIFLQNSQNLMHIDNTILFY